MEKILTAISEKVAEEATQTLFKSLKQLTTAERLFVLGTALVGLSIISADRELEKKQKDSKKSS